MNKDKSAVEQVQKVLLERFYVKGMLTESEIIDACIEHDLSIVDIDFVCEKLLSKNVIITDIESSTIDNNEEYEDYSQTDYDTLYREILTEYPNFEFILLEIRNIVPPQQNEYRVLIPEAKAGNHYARERLIKMYLRQIVRIAYFFSKSNKCDFEDAFQCGVIGLIKAIEKYDVTSPEKFPSYFSLWVLNHMQRFSYIEGTIVRFPAHYKDKLYDLINYIAPLMDEIELEILLDSMSESDLQKYIVNANIKPEHILPYVELTEELSEKYLICNQDNEEYSDIENKDLAHLIQQTLSKLSDREKTVIEYRFGLNDGNARTLEEVGDILGVTRERIRQIEGTAIRKISNSLIKNSGRDFYYM